MSGRNLEEVVRILPPANNGAAPESSAQRLKELLDAARACQPAAVFRRYAHSGDLGVPSKVSVSALKRAHEQPAVLSPQRLPAEDDGITAAERGTLMHRVLEVMGIGRKTEDEVAAAVQELAASRRMIRIWPGTWTRRPSPVPAQRSATRAGRRKMPVRAAFLPEHERAGLARGFDEAVIVQGVIDMCFAEDGKWVVVDYKTDRVDAGRAAEAAQNTPCS